MIYILFILPKYFVLEKSIVNQWFLGSSSINIHWLVNCAIIMNDSDILSICIFLIFIPELYCVMAYQRRRIKLFSFFVFGLIIIFWITISEMYRIFTNIPTELLVLILDWKHLWVLRFFLWYWPLALLV